MEQRAYHELARVADRHWWYVGRRLRIARPIVLATIALVSLGLWFALRPECYTSIHPEYAEVDLDPLIHIDSAEDVARLRERLYRFLWGQSGFPAHKLPLSVTRTSPSDWPEWASQVPSSNLMAVQRLDIGMDYDLHSYAYLLRPVRANERLLIVHLGHTEHPLAYGGDEVVGPFLDAGFSLVLLWMPLFGENSLVARDVPGYGSVEFRRNEHGAMAEKLDSEGASFIRFFIEPVVVAINYAVLHHDFKDITMTGISGGGWATHVSAALDPRIGLSLPVAGSLPLYLREGPCPPGIPGDAEQLWAPLYVHLASWLDLYVLGGYGVGRGQIHILNQYDGCCFGGIGYRTYEPRLAELMKRLGAGFYGVYVDSTHRDHKISRTVVERIMKPALATTLANQGAAEAFLGQRRGIFSWLGTAPW